jgi:hypothetical protein
LSALVFPAPPPPMAVGGTDLVSAAIGEALPVIESPVIDGLPAVRTAVARTGASIASAAELYADTDRRLGEHVNLAVDWPVGTMGARAARGARAAGAAGDETPELPGQTPLPVADQPAARIGQIAALTRTLGPVTQNVQSVMSVVQGAAGNTGGGAAPPARLAGEVDEGEPGAAPGEQTSESVPVASADSGLPNSRRLDRGSVE